MTWFIMRWLETRNNFTMDPKGKGIFGGSCMEESLLRDGVDIESAKAFESLSAKQQGRFQREPWRDKGFQEAKQKWFQRRTWRLEKVEMQELMPVLMHLHHSLGFFKYRMSRLWTWDTWDCFCMLQLSSRHCRAEDLQNKFVMEHTQRIHDYNIFTIINLHLVDCLWEISR